MVAPTLPLAPSTPIRMGNTLASAAGRQRSGVVGDSNSAARSDAQRVIRARDATTDRCPSVTESDAEALVAQPVHITVDRDIRSGRRQGCPVADPAFPLRAHGEGVGSRR